MSNNKKYDAYGINSVGQVWGQMKNGNGDQLSGDNFAREIAYDRENDRVWVVTNQTQPGQGEDGFIVAYLDKDTAREGVNTKWTFVTGSNVSQHTALTKIAA